MPYVPTFSYYNSFYNENMNITLLLWICGKNQNQVSGVKSTRCKKSKVKTWNQISRKPLCIVCSRRIVTKDTSQSHKVKKKSFCKCVSVLSYSTCDLIFIHFFKKNKRQPLEQISEVTFASWLGTVNHHQDKQKDDPPQSKKKRESKIASQSFYTTTITKQPSMHYYYQFIYLLTFNQALSCKYAYIGMVNKKDNFTLSTMSTWGYVCC